MNPKGHKNHNIGSKVMPILLDGVDFASWWNCIGKGLRLHAAQQACSCSFMHLFVINVLLIFFSRACSLNILI